MDQSKGVPTSGIKRAASESEVPVGHTRNRSYGSLRGASDLPSYDNSRSNSVMKQNR